MMLPMNFLKASPAEKKKSFESKQKPTQLIVDLLKEQWQQSVLAAWDSPRL